MVLYADAAHSVPLDEIALHQEIDFEKGSNKSSENDVTTTTNGATESSEDKVKASKSVNWSEQLVSQSTYTPSIDPDSSPHSYFSSRSNPYVYHSSAPCSHSSPTYFKVLQKGYWGNNAIDPKQGRCRRINLKKGVFKGCGG